MKNFKNKIQTHNHYNTVYTFTKTLTKNYTNNTNYNNDQKQIVPFTLIHFPKKMSSLEIQNNEECTGGYRCEETYPPNCIPLKFICDGYNDCPLKDDEKTENCALKPAGNFSNCFFFFFFFFFFLSSFLLLLLMVYFVACTMVR